VKKNKIQVVYLRKDGNRSKDPSNSMPLAAVNIIGWDFRTTDNNTVSRDSISL